MMVVDERARRTGDGGRQQGGPSSRLESRFYVSVF